MKKIITRISNKKKIDISKMTYEELVRLHFEEESYAAKKLQEFPAFSEERTQLLTDCYEIIQLIRSYQYKIKPKKVQNKAMEFKLSKKVLKEIKKSPIKVLEIGCGEGTLINRFSQEPGLELFCCDVQEANINDKIHFINDTIFNALSTFDDCTIDLIIADNVCEHFLPDEADTIYDLIYQKLSPKGKIIILMPNINLGPSDISKNFLKIKERPLGFHFMEQTYKDNIKLFNKHKLYTDYLVIMYKEQFHLIPNLIFLDNIKICFENIFGNIKNLKKRKKFFDHLGYKAYVLKKK